MLLMLFNEPSPVKMEQLVCMCQAIMSMGHTSDGVLRLVGQLAHGLAAQVLLLCVPDQDPAQAADQRRRQAPCTECVLFIPAGLHLMSYKQKHMTTSRTSPNRLRTTAEQMG